MLEFERMELNRERLRELILAECQHYKDIRLAAAAGNEASQQWAFIIGALQPIHMKPN